MSNNQFRKIGALSGLVTLAMICGISTAAAQTVLTVTHSSPEDSHFGQGAMAFKEKLEEQTNGSIKVVIQRLDNEREALESVQLGSQECAIVSTGPLGNFVPETRVLDVPFLFDGYVHARGALDSEIGQQLLSLFPKYGLEGVAWMENGFRNLTTGSKQIESPEDLKGLKIRTMENAIHIQAWKAAGVLPTPMAFSELPSALQQGTVDGQENPIPVILANNLDMMQQHIYLTRHVYSAGILACNPDFVAGLDASQREALQEAGAAGAAVNRARVEQDDTLGILTLIDRGIDVVEIEDVGVYRAAMASAYAGFESQFGQTMQKIREWRAE